MKDWIKKVRYSDLTWYGRVLSVLLGMFVFIAPLLFSGFLEESVQVAGAGGIIVVFLVMLLLWFGFAIFLFILLVTILTIIASVYWLFTGDGYRFDYIDSDMQSVLEEVTGSLAFLLLVLLGDWWMKAND